ncbi:uncharacterized protein LOC143460979 [Clavelina lepadiformis]|uniref:OCIA domain-containing protein 1 n=1 Tax=Clavelina lepadiformis TaxID=159417 RepID=A0ABP0FXQ2_CLALP
MDSSRQGTSKQFNLLPEEKELLKNLQREAAIYRGYPTALVVGLLSNFGLKRYLPKVNALGRASLTILACLIGNGVGKMTYIPVVLERIKLDLPESSELRQAVIEATNKGSSNVGSVIFPQPGNEYKGKEAFHYSEQRSNDDNELTFEKPIKVSSGTTNENSGDKLISYSDLRAKYRNMESEKIYDNQSGYSSPDVQQPTHSYGGSIDKIPKQRVNKYGDLIIDE